MEADRHQYELRSGSRSRSQTPLVPNRARIESDVIEHPYDLRSRSRERSHSPGDMTSSRQSGSTSLNSGIGKTQDQSVEKMLEKREETILENQSKRCEHSLPISTKKERRSERQRAKRQIFANGQRESKGDSSMQKHEEKHKSVSPHRLLTSDYSSEEGDHEVLPNRPNSAYEIYKQAGEWWNVFPKTDYTYSLRSQCRYEIAPGVLAMPNMSRRSIHSDDNNTISISQERSTEISQPTERSESGLGETMLSEESKEMRENRSNTLMDDGSHELSSSRKLKLEYPNTHITRYLCRREVTLTAQSEWKDSKKRIFPHSPTLSKNLENPKYPTSTIDSDTELDEAVSISGTRIPKAAQWMSSLIIIVTLWFSKLLEFLKLRTVKRRDYRPTYEYQRYHEPQRYRMSRYADDWLQYVYLLMVRILYFDSWLLSRVSNIRRWTEQRGLTVLWLALLPLLLLTGTYIVQNQSFIHLDSLSNIPHGATQTTYRIFNDITNLTSFEYDLLLKYIMNIQNSSSHYLPRVNVSLPEMPNIGWNISW